MEECKKEYYYNGNIYREVYYKDGKCHRDNLPAVIYYFENENGKIDSEYYYKHGNVHREDGPAVIDYYYNGKIVNEQYYLYDKFYGDKDIIDNWKVFCKVRIFA